MVSSYFWCQMMHTTKMYPATEDQYNIHWICVRCKWVVSCHHHRCLHLQTLHILEKNWSEIHFKKGIARPYLFENCLSILKEMINGSTYFIKANIVFGMDISISSDLFLEITFSYHKKLNPFWWQKVFFGKSYKNIWFCMKISKVFKITNPFSTWWELVWLSEVSNVSKCILIERIHIWKMRLQLYFNGRWLWLAFGFSIISYPLMILVRIRAIHGFRLPLFRSYTVFVHFQSTTSVFKYL